MNAYSCLPAGYPCGQQFVLHQSYSGISNTEREEDEGRDEMQSSPATFFVERKAWLILIKFLPCKTCRWCVEYGIFISIELAECEASCKALCCKSKYV